MDSGSIFTYDHEPPSVLSPWLSAGVFNDKSRSRVASTSSTSVDDVEIENLDLGSVTRLQAEPQEGPTEYKLHLLLRPRKSVSAGVPVTARTPSRSASVSPFPSSPSTPPSLISRQHRLEQLTTQLLWRLQQSSPYHTASADNLVLPTLPPATPELRPPEQLAKLTPGLEESKGALYEIGVSDDGTLIGLTSQEMNESLNNLRAMAASLGCSVEVQRMICVGDRDLDEDDASLTHVDRLYVAEAFVKPELHNDSESRDMGIGNELGSFRSNGHDTVLPWASVEQLRVSLTGATTCGKSSLLGTLSTSTLDNAKGKSRLSLLKHRHEIASGVTSSVAQELVGYADATKDHGKTVQVINYAKEKVLTWTDIHATPNLSRVALLSDSAGHPRYRRTAVRGLVGWAPHWTLLCIAANEDHSVSGHETESHDLFSGANAHISMAHLDLCLRLQIPFVIVITKFDEATRSGLRQLMSTLLTRLKSAGRRPVVVPNQSTTKAAQGFTEIPRSDLHEIEKLMESLSPDPCSTVLILLTSAVTGVGIPKVHALLRCLPLPSTILDGVDDEETGSLFRVDDSFLVPSLVSFHHASSMSGIVVSGYVTHGSITLGDNLTLGPFPAHQAAPSSSTPDLQASPSLLQDDVDDPFLSPRSFSDALARTTASPRLRPADPTREWRQVRVVSIRNLRLPVRTLHADQVGTIGVVPIDDGSPTSEHGYSRRPLPSIRKGMVLTTGNPGAMHTFTARFSMDEANSVVVGSVVIVYCATIRAGARVVAVALDHRSPSPLGNMDDASDPVNQETGFRFDDEGEPRATMGDGAAGSSQASALLVTFQFVTSKECLETGSKVLIMPSDGLGGDKRSIRGLVGALEGFVGTVTEAFG